MGPVCAKPDDELSMSKRPDMKVKGLNTKAKWGQEDDPGEERYIEFEDQEITVGEATAAAKKWVDEQNKVVYGRYTFNEHNVKVVPRISQRIDYVKEVFKFKVHFRVTRRNTRWI